MRIPHPIPYQGSKRNIANDIIAHFPIGNVTLIEPFAGSAAVTLAAISQGKIEKVLLNDLNGALIELWDWIINQPECLADHYEALWHSQQGQERDYYDLVRTRFNQTHKPSDFLYLLVRCVKAAIRYNAQGEFNQSPDNRRKGTHPNTMRVNIMGASALLKGKVILTHTDYKDTLLNSKPTALVYLDPPYQGVSEKRDPRYLGGFSYDSFVEMLRFLNERHIAYILSYDGRTGTKAFGKPLPESLHLRRFEINAGRSTQATLLGRQADTFESIYLSPALGHRELFKVSA